MQPDDVIDPETFPFTLREVREGLSLMSNRDVASELEEELRLLLPVPAVQVPGPRPRFTPHVEPDWLYLGVLHRSPLLRHRVRAFVLAQCEQARRTVATQLGDPLAAKQATRAAGARAIRRLRQEWWDAIRRARELDNGS